MIATYWAAFLAYKHSGKIIIGAGLIIALLIVWFCIWLFSSKTEKPLDNQQLNEYIEKQREKDTQIHNSQENRSESVISTVQKRDVETKVNVNKSKGISGKDLDKLAGEQ